MNNRTVILAVLLLVLYGVQVVGAVPAPERDGAGPILAVVDDSRGLVYVMVEEDDGRRKTAVFSAQDGTLLRRFDVGGPMALDGTRGRLYISSPDGVVVVNIETGAVLRTLPAVPAKTWRTGDAFLPAVVVSNTGEVLVVSGPEAVVFPPESEQPSRRLPFTSEKFRAADGSWLTANQIAFDQARGLLHGSFLIHSQASSGIGGSFTVDELIVLDVMSGHIVGRFEAYNLHRMAVDPVTGRLVVNVGGDARMWAGADGWSAELKGLRLDGDQNLQVDGARRRVYARNQNGALVALDLDSLALRGVAQISPDETVVGLNLRDGLLYMARELGHLTVVAESSVGDTLMTATGDWPPPDSPVRVLAVLPDGRMAAAWEAREIGFSVDGGNRWNGKVAGGLVLAVPPQFDSDRTVLFAPDSLGVFRSEDGGMSWQISSAGLRNFDVEWVAFSPNHTVDGMAYLYARTGLNMFGFPQRGELYRSGDGGRTWQAMPSQSKGLESVAVTDGAGAALVAVCADGPMPGPGVFAGSPDQGMTWQNQGASPAFPVMGGLSAAPLYAKWGVGFIFGTDGALYRSQDFGTTWSEVWRGAPQGISWGHTGTWASIAYGPDIEVGRPVFLVLKWDAIQDGQARPQGVLYVSADGGLTWQSGRLPEGLNPTAVAVPPDFAQSGRFYLGLADGTIAALNWADVK